MNAGRESLLDRRERGTTQAWTRAADGTPEILLTFTDLVRDGEIVSVFPTEEDAIDERGIGEPMVVRYDKGLWFVEPVA